MSHHMDPRPVSKFRSMHAQRTKILHPAVDAKTPEISAISLNILQACDHAKCKTTKPTSNTIPSLNPGTKKQTACAYTWQ